MQSSIYLTANTHAGQEGKPGVLRLDACRVPCVPSESACRCRSRVRGSQLKEREIKGRIIGQSVTSEEQVMNNVVSGQDLRVRLFRFNRRPIASEITMAGFPQCYLFFILARYLF